MRALGPRLAVWTLVQVLGAVGSAAGDDPARRDGGPLAGARALPRAPVAAVLADLARRAARSDDAVEPHGHGPQRPLAAP